MGTSVLNVVLCKISKSPRNSLSSTLAHVIPAPLIKLFTIMVGASSPLGVSAVMRKPFLNGYFLPLGASKRV